MLLFDLGLTLPGLRTEETQPLSGEKLPAGGKETTPGDAGVLQRCLTAIASTDYSSVSFGSLTRSIRDRYLGSATELPPGPQPAVAQTDWVSALMGSVAQARDWAGTLLTRQTTGAEPAPTDGRVTALFGGLVAKVQAGFEDMSQWLSGSQTRAASYASPEDAAVATISGITERLKALAAVRQEAMATLREHQSELSPELRQETLERIKSFDEKMAGLWGQVAKEQKLVDETLQQRAPQLCPTYRRACDECTTDCRTRSDRILARTDLMRRRIQSNEATPEEIHAFNEELHALTEEHTNLGREILAIPQRTLDLMDEYAPEVDHGAWASVRETIQQIRDGFAEENEYYYDEYEDSLHELTYSSERYEEALNLQWVPMIGITGEGPFAASNLYFYGQLDELNKQLGSTLLTCADEAHVALQTLAAVETVLDHDEDRFQATFLEDTPVVDPKTFAAPIIGDVEQQLEVQEERTQEVQLRRLEQLYGLRGFDRENPSADLRLMELMPDVLLTTEQEEREAESVRAEARRYETQTEAVAEELASRTAESSGKEEEERQESARETALRAKLERELEQLRQELEVSLREDNSGAVAKRDENVDDDSRRPSWFERIL